MGAKVGGGSFDDINMTPLIDIVLVVLIIMMVNIPIAVQSLGVKLPGPVDSPPPPQTDDIEQLVLAAYENGDMALNRRMMPEEMVFGEITRRLRPMEKKIVFIDAHPALGYGRVVDLVDLAKEAGAAKVAFAKMKEAGPLPATSVAEGAMPRGVIFGSPSVVGAITEKRADEKFRPAVAAVESCYATRLVEVPALTGRVVLKVGIWPEGQIESVGIAAETVGDQALLDCLLQVAGQLRYEALGEGNTALVHYPMLFSPG